MMTNKVAIPQFIADIFELNSTAFPNSKTAVELIIDLFVGRFDIDFQQGESTYRTLKWLENSNNLKTFVDAFDNGYKVEEDRRRRYQ
ncbi:DUF1642 domain-containing protein [Pediococcus pentosaceus]|uniref:DUF1642 domain-containing protein n=1 Tax=Pediococcus pentosaceus TaxID=1255 RepID=A0ABD7X8X3_PEDPE|nr:DUF1642 domain-containing protein [Pediococcus pentosaceus]WEA58256.1 DUF1642 domain-containing protein [Pediococcus pentosaceus]